jgi:hypothetical protein
LERDEERLEVLAALEPPPAPAPSPAGPVFLASAEPLPLEEPLELSDDGLVLSAPEPPLPPAAALSADEEPFSEAPLSSFAGASDDEEAPSCWEVISR